jgi:hypothetical protein
MFRRELCKYFVTGGCSRGSECPFSHDLAADVPAGADDQPGSCGFVLDARVANLHKIAAGDAPISKIFGASRGGAGTPAAATLSVSPPPSSVPSSASSTPKSPPAASFTAMRGAAHSVADRGDAAPSRQLRASAPSWAPASVAAEHDGAAARTHRHGHEHPLTPLKAAAFASPSLHPSVQLAQTHYHGSGLAPAPHGSHAQAYFHAATVAAPPLATHMYGAHGAYDHVQEPSMAHDAFAYGAAAVDPQLQTYQHAPPYFHASYAHLDHASFLQQQALRPPLQVGASDSP